MYSYASGDECGSLCNCEHQTAKSWFVGLPETWVLASTSPARVHQALLEYAKLSATFLESRDSEPNKEGAMLEVKYFSRTVVIGGAVALAACAVIMGATTPRGWFLAGTKPAEYEAGVDADQPYQGHASAFLKSKAQSVDGFGTLMQSIHAEQYKGKRVRLSGYVRSEGVMSWAALWMRVDQGKDMVAFTLVQIRISICERKKAEHLVA